jgi:hypothetical protein
MLRYLKMQRQVSQRIMNYKVKRATLMRKQLSWQRRGERRRRPPRKAKRVGRKRRSLKRPRR